MFFSRIMLGTLGNEHPEMRKNAAEETKKRESEFESVRK